MTQEERQSFWYKHIQTCERSGSKIVAYCKQHDLSESQFYSYRKRLKKIQSVHFHEVKQAEVKCIEFKVNGLHIVISKEQLPHFMEALRD